MDRSLLDEDNLMRKDAPRQQLGAETPPVREHGVADALSAGRHAASVLPLTRTPPTLAAALGEASRDDRPVLIVFYAGADKTLVGNMLGKFFGNSRHVGDCVWIVKSWCSPKQAYDRMRPVIRSFDSVIVADRRCQDVWHHNASDNVPRLLQAVRAADRNGA